MDEHEGNNESIMASKSITHRPTNDPTLRKAIYKAFEGKCFYTGRKVSFANMHIDHVVPKSKGSEDSIFNYVLSCSDINLAKGHRFDAKIS